MNTWAQHPDRLLLLELHVLGQARHRKSQEPAWSRLHDMRWTYSIGRHEEALADNRRDDLVRLLSEAWPTWRDALTELQAAGEPPTPDGWRTLEDLQRQRRAPVLPGRVNQHTLAAAIAPHAKSSLTASRIECAGDVDITHDGSLRLRPPPGLIARAGEHTVNLWDASRVLGEVLITDRAIRDGLYLTGQLPAAVVSIENLGPYMDAQLPDNWLAIHVPGWNTALVPSVVNLIPAAIPWIHWGDYDFNGMRIARSLRESRPNIGWFVPEWIDEYLGHYARAATWGDGGRDAVRDDDMPGVIKHLIDNGKAMEQEVLALDNRLAGSMVRMVEVQSV